MEKEESRRGETIVNLEKSLRNIQTIEAQLQQQIDSL